MSVVMHGAERGGVFASMDSEYTDPRDAYSLEGEILGARHEDLARNHPVASAMVSSIIETTLGPDGLEYFSAYQADPADPITTDEDLAAQDAINSWVTEATAGTRYDAAGTRTLRDLCADALWCYLLPGTGLVTRVHKPHRGGDPLTAYCARLIHPRRLSNPDHRPDTENLVHGWELDADGDPIACHIKTHRRVLSGGIDSWTRWPTYGADGLRNVCLLTGGHHPERIQGFGLLAPVIELLKSFSGTIKAYVVGKQIQASFPIIIRSSDPKVLEAAKRMGVYLGPENAHTVKIRPNRVLICHTSCEHIFTQLNFNGADMRDFADGVIAQACAACGLSPDVVMKRLPKTSLSSARAAIADHWRMVETTRARLVDYILRPIIEWVIAEGALRGHLPAALRAAPLRRLTVGTFEGLAMPEPDPKKAVDAVAALIHDIGASPTTGFRRLGYNFRRQVLQRGADNRWSAGVVGANIPTGRRSDAPPAPSIDPDDTDGEPDSGALDAA